MDAAEMTMFAKTIRSATDALPDTDDRRSEEQRLRRSLRRRERRIAFLKRKLRQHRAWENAELHAAREIIASLEELLLAHRPRTMHPDAAYIADLERQLAAMTQLAEMLFRRSKS